MKKVRITVMRMACYPDLMAQYENPMEHPCDMTLGQVFVTDGWTRPEGGRTTRAANQVQYSDRSKEQLFY